MKPVELRQLTMHDMPYLWGQSHQEKMPEWAKLNAPYFREYKQMSLDRFLEKEASWYINTPQRLGIFVDNTLVGNIMYYWEHEGSRWMEFGLVIYNEAYWGHAIGYQASVQLIKKVFHEFPEIQRIGCTSWSGNPGMMRLAEKLGMQLEGRMRKTRFWNGTYYDSLRYGILREEWDKQTENNIV